MKVRIYILIIFSIIIGSNAYSQRQDYIWYFGDGTDGMKFDSLGNVTKLTNKYQSGTFGYEAMVTVNDPLTGNLLFYSDGMTVVDRTHSVMTNGTNLMGNYDNAQGVTCCRVPKTCDKYYVIYNSASDNDTGLLYYSIVDFSSTTNGKVTNKNTSFGGINYHQGMTIIPRRNKNEYWIVVHKYQTAKYEVFLIDSSGFSSPTTYTFSNTGRSWTLRYNQNAGKIVCVGQDNIKVSLFDFNDSTGVMSNETQIGSGFSNGVFGGNFSPDGSKVYALVMSGSNVTELQQYDFSNSSWVNTANCCFAHDMKKAPNGYMYHIHTYNNTNPLAVIKKPNLSATANAFQYSTITSPGSFNGNVRRFPEFVMLGAFPKTANDTFTINASDSLSIPTANILSNDTDPQGDSIYFGGIYSPPKYGSVSLVGNNLIYKPNTCGKTDTIIYKLIDHWCTFDTGYIIITIKGMGNINIISKDSVCNGKSVTLKTDYSGVKGSYFWSGPNGFAGNADSATINNFSSVNEGTYSVYIVLNSCTTNVASFDIHIKNCVQASYTYNNKCNGTIDFTNTSKNFTKIKWLFGDNTVDSINANPTHNYAINNAYSAILIAYDGSGETDTFKVSISTASDTTNTSSFSVSKTSGCDTLTCLFTNTSIGATNYVWNFGDGSPVDTNKNIVHKYITSGYYTVKLMTIDSIGCKFLDSSYAVINVYVKPKSSFSYSKAGCTTQIDFKNNTTNATTYTWKFGDGNTSNSTNITLSHTYASLGNYLVKLIATSANGCVDSSQQLIVITNDTINNAAFNVSAKSGCSPIKITFANASKGATNYIWDFGDGNTDTNYNTSHTYSVVGSYTVTLISIDSFGCTMYDTASTIINVFASPTASFSFNQIACTDSVVFTNNSSSGISYTWNFGDGNTDTNFNTTHNYNNTGNYKVLLTAVNGSCQDTELMTVPITIDSLNKASFFADNYGGCIPLDIKFTNKSVGATNYVWDFGDGGVDTNANTTHIFTQAGDYIVKLVSLDPNGCVLSDTFSKTFKVITSITADFTYTLNTCTGVVSFADASSQSNKWEWYLVPDTLFSKVQNPDQKFNGDGDYDVKLIAYSGNSCRDSITKTLSLTGINNALYFPNAFSPNGDGLNDKFEVLGNLNCIVNFHMEIFNRWGEKIFQSDSLSTQWDGKTNSGKEVPEGVYIYIFKSKDIDMTGNVKLVR